MTLLEQIDKLRTINGNISINRLEREAGLTRGSICKWDKHMPSYDKLKKVADYFGVTVEYLQGENSNDVYSITFRSNLKKSLEAIENSGYMTDEYIKHDYQRLTNIANSTHPLTLAEACEAADVLGESLDLLIFGENKKSPPSVNEDGLSREERIILSLVSQIPFEKQEFLVSWLQTELQQGE